MTTQTDSAEGAEPAGVTISDPGQQAEPAAQNVTPAPRKTAATAAERKRRQRERERSASLMFSQEDWQMFLDLQTLPQKAGCHPSDLRQLVLKELADNALDAGANVTITRVDQSWVVRDDGPGIDPDNVPDLFCVNRALVSSKLLRMPTRGALGNGLRVVVGAVAATGGSLVVETRGRRLRLAVDHRTGLTDVVTDEAVPFMPGTTVEIGLGTAAWSDGRLALRASILAKYGKPYDGPSSPWWYSADNLLRVFKCARPEGITVSAVCSHLGIDIDDQRPAVTLTRDDAAAVLESIRTGANRVAPERLGKLGRDAFEADWPGYHCVPGETSIVGAQIPYIVEAWAHCRRVESRGRSDVDLDLHVNRTPTLARIHGVNYTDGGVGLRGCGLTRAIDTPAGIYNIKVSVITPYVQITTDGKEPDLAPFSTAIADAVGKACRVAHRAMTKPVKNVSLKDAAGLVMEDAYLKASAGGTLPANARQIMYAARPAILELTGGKIWAEDSYFTQRLLPDYVVANPEQTASWNVVFDSRGTFIEPHTGREVPIGTLEVAGYLGDRPHLGRVIDVADASRFPTSGPQNRYSSILFIEKEGFDPLLRHVELAERFDIAIMSTKGMSVTAARHLLDRLAMQVERVLVLHDFDVAGFSIFGTLGTDGRRHQFENAVPVHDLGLRLADTKAMDLAPERVTIKGSWDAVSNTLRRHGATDDEVDFLCSHRVELNAMTSDQFIAFLERKLAEHGVAKVVPEAETLEQHARRVLEQKLAEDFIREHLERLAREAAATALPTDLEGRVRDLLQRHPAIAWDEAVAHVVRAYP